MIGFAQMRSFSLSNLQRLLLLSAVTSLLAFTLLRVLSCEVSIFAYLQNYVYACALFGLAMGCLDSRMRRINAATSNWFIVFAIALALVAILLGSPPGIGALKDGSTYFLNPQFPSHYLFYEIVATVVLFTVFMLVVRCFVPLGFAIGALCSEDSGGRGLALFWLGSIIGLAVYFVSLWLMSPPVILVALLGAAFLLLSGRSIVNLVACVVAIGCSVFFDAAADSYGAPVDVPKSEETSYFKKFWAPEGHIVTRPILSGDKVVGFNIFNNRIPYQLVIDTGLDEQQCSAVGTSDDSLKGYTSQYFNTPFLVSKKPEHVLILGGGAGNEAAEALRVGAADIDTVDNRPWMFQLGDQHPQHPFQSPRVHKIVLDPRQFLRESSKKYDLIYFGALESMSAFSPFGLLRPDNFMYTTEALLDARDRLSSQGYTALSFRPFRQWYVLRLVSNFKEGYGTLDAMVRSPFRSYMFASREQNRLLSTLLLESFKPRQLGNVEKIMEDASAVPPTIDDWPFLYLAAPGLPRTYLFCFLLMIAAMLIQLRPLLRKPEADKMSALPGRKEEAGVSPASDCPEVAIGGRSLRILILGIAFMLAAGKTVMTLGFNYGTGWQTAMIAPMLIAICALLPAALGCRGVRLPPWLVWVLVILAYVGDYCFNYEAVVSIGNSTVRFLAAGLLPLLPPLFVAAALERSLSETTDYGVDLSMLFFGMVMGLFLEHACLTTTISTLDIPGVILCVSAIFVRPKTAAALETNRAT